MARHHLHRRDGTNPPRFPARVRPAGKTDTCQKPVALWRVTPMLVALLPPDIFKGPGWHVRWPARAQAAPRILSRRSPRGNKGEGPSQATAGGRRVLEAPEERPGANAVQRVPPCHPERGRGPVALCARTSFPALSPCEAREGICVPGSCPWRSVRACGQPAGLTGPRTGPGLQGALSAPWRVTTERMSG